MEKWYNLETNNAAQIKAVRIHCKENKIPYETSDAGFGLTHFEIYCDAEQVKTIDNLLDDVLNLDHYDDTWWITESV